MKNSKTIYRIIRIDFEYDPDKYTEKEAETAASNTLVSSALAFEDERDGRDILEITDITDCGESI